MSTEEIQVNIRFGSEGLSICLLRTLCHRFKPTEPGRDERSGCKLEHCLPELTTHLPRRLYCKLERKKTNLRNLFILIVHLNLAAKLVILPPSLPLAHLWNVWKSGQRYGPACVLEDVDFKLHQVFSQAHQ